MQVRWDHGRDSKAMYIESSVNKYECTMDQELYRIEQANDITRARLATRQPVDAAAYASGGRKSSSPSKMSNNLLVVSLGISSGLQRLHPQIIETCSRLAFQRQYHRSILSV